jgi:excinuclease ABC subunit A
MSASSFRESSPARFRLHHPEIEPRLFSFNNPQGACPTCDGLGTELRFEEALMVPDKTLSLRQGAIAPWAKTGNTSPYYTQTLDAICKHYKASMSHAVERAADEGAGCDPVRHGRGDHLHL